MMILSLDDLCDELLIEVFCRLPHKYVTQCKCVSKRWFSLISNPDFACRSVSCRLFNKEQQQQPWTFIYYGNCTTKDPPRLTSMDTVFNSPGFSLSFFSCYQPQKARPIFVLKTFNDLVLCCGEEFIQTTYYIGNPLTKQWLAVPPHPTCHLRVIVEFICEPYCVEDQRQPYHLVLNDQYKFKVVRIPHPFALRKRNKLKFEIFSSQTGQWNETQMILPPETFEIGGIIDHLVCNGKLTLLTVGSNGLRTISVGDQFDKCHVVSIPGTRRYIKYSFLSSWRLVPCQGHQRMALVSKAMGIPAPPVLHIWELKDRDDVGEWELVHEVSFANMASSSEWFSNYFLKRTCKDDNFLTPIVLGFHPHDMNVLYLNLNCDDGYMALYNMQNRSLNLVSRGLLPPLIHRSVYQLKIPLWSTPMPKVGHQQADSSK